MDDPLDITNHDSPFGAVPKEVRVSYTPADPLAATIVEVVRECSKLKIEQFATAMREEGLSEETVQRVLNRVQTGHPDGVEHWARVIGERYGSGEGPTS